MRRALIIIQLALIALCMLPVAGVAWSSWFADRHGCVLNEAGVHSCVVNGHDWGTELAAAFVTGWLMLVTLPVAALLVVTLIATLIIPPLWRRMRK